MTREDSPTSSGAWASVGAATPPEEAEEIEEYTREPEEHSGTDGVALSDTAQFARAYGSHGQMMLKGIRGEDLARIAKGEITLDDYLKRGL